MCQASAGQGSHQDMEDEEGHSGNTLPQLHAGHVLSLSPLSRLHPGSRSFLA